MTTAAGKGTRRSHAKTRSGCLNCKKRKVKCGEERPSCRNCTRRAEPCSLSGRPVSPNALEADPSPRSQTLGGRQNTQPNHELAPSADSGDDSVGLKNLTLLDMELLHHYSTSAYRTLSSDPIVREWFLANVPKIGFTHHYVLYSVLALAASHLAHFRPRSRQYYYAKATSYHTLATSIATPILSSLSPENLIPMYAFSTLTMFISFANLKEEDDLFFDANNIIPTWLTLFRGVRTILEFDNRAIQSSSISFLFNDRGNVNRDWSFKQLKHDSLIEFENHISMSTSEDDEARTHLLDTFHHLRSAFHAFYGEELCNEDKIRSIFTWLYVIKDEYINLLRERNENALCILGFFCVLLHRLEYNWWLKGWSVHLIDRIYTALDEVHRLWVRWPIQEIGWVP